MQTFSHDNQSWSKVRGPLSALRMCIYRLGWAMPDFTTLRDDFGRDISLTLSPPRLIKVLCRDAVLRNLERDSGDKYGVGHRLCWDVVKQQLS
eukprot:8233221-Pyramimonas_sp.AAC.1